MLETHLKFCMAELDFLGERICPQNWGNGPKMCQKQGFLNLLENLIINFYWICSIMKINIICCIPAQILYLWKLFFLRHTLSQSDCRIFKSIISPEKLMKQPLIFANSQKLKIDGKVFGWVWSKMGVVNLVSGLENWLYLKNEQM